jgi:hypothetical protein
MNITDRKPTHDLPADDQRAPAADEWGTRPGQVPVMWFNLAPDAEGGPGFLWPEGDGEGGE